MPFCLKWMNSNALALGEHFPSTADHRPLLASCSLGFGSVSWPHFSAQVGAIHARIARLQAASFLFCTLPARAAILVGDLMAIVGSSQSFTLVVWLMESVLA